MSEDTREMIPLVNERGETRHYESVASRVKRFRDSDKHGAWTINTSIYMLDNESVVVRCEIGYWTEAGIFAIQATGHAEEWRGSSAINATSAVENAETSAIGRALAALGYASTESFASANEVTRALSKRQAVDNARPGALILLQQAAANGRKALEDAWNNSLSKPDRLACKNDLPKLKAIAAQADSEWHKQGNEDAMQTGPDGMDQ